MQCPTCKGKKGSQVVHTRRTLSGAIRRRRECYACGERFTTIEVEQSLFEELRREVRKFNSWFTTRFPQHFKEMKDER